MKLIHTYRFLLLCCIGLFGTYQASGQFLLQAPNSSDEHNYKWFEASDTNAILGTNFFYEVSAPGVYFATYDGTLCGKNATSYFIVTDCSAPNNEIILDISANVPSSATVSWVPTVSGDPLRPQVIASQSVIKYTATLTKVGNTIDLPSFTVVCLQQAANLVDDLVTVNEDESAIVDIFTNDTNLPTTGTLTTTSPVNGTVSINNNGTPNDPTDDVVTYTPNPDFNGADTFDYTICNTMGDCSTAKVDINVLPIVDALDDAVTTMENQSVDIFILANDNDIPTIGTLTVTAPSNGTVQLNTNATANNPTDDNVTYLPNPGFIGTDTFDYILCDNQGNCSTATVSIVVTPLGIVNIDADDDGILDSFEDLNLDGDNDPATNPTDTDGDGMPDYLDIDSDDDGIPDNVEAQLTQGYIPPSGLDLNNNGLDDAYEQGGNLGLISVDTDGDGLPDYVDEDSDNDRIPDSIEGHDFDHNGIPDVVWIGSDKDNDGLDDGYEGSVVIDVDVNDGIDDPFAYLPNTDSDDESDYRDTDDDGDGIETIDEDLDGDGNYVNDDSDNDGTPNYLDSDLIATADEIEVFNVVTPNGDGIHDVLAIRGLENFPKNTIKIFNRWGVLVYVTNSYNTQGNVFDGTSNGRVTIDKENKLPVGTYFYILDYGNASGKLKSISGYIYINR